MALGSVHIPRRLENSWQIISSLGYPLTKKKQQQYCSGLRGSGHFGLYFREDILNSGSEFDYK